MSPITRASILPILPLLAFTASLVAQGGEQTLRTSAKKGAAVWMLQEKKEENTIDQGGQQFEINNTTTHTVHVSVKDVDDKGMLVVEAEVVRVHGAMQMGPMGDVEFDSANPPEDDEEDGGGFGMPTPGAISKQMTALAGKKFTAKVDARGKVGSLEGVADLLKSKRPPGMMGGGITEGTLKTLVESAFGMMPEQPVAVGTTWDHVEPGTGNMRTNNKMTMTLAKLDEKTFEITATGTVEQPQQKPDAGEGEGEGDEGEAMRREMMKSTKIQNGKLNGSQKVSREDGFVIEASTVVSMDVEMSTPMGDMSMSVKTTTTTKRTTAEAAMPKKAEPAKEPAKEAATTGGK